MNDRRLFALCLILCGFTLNEHVINSLLAANPGPLMSKMLIRAWNVAAICCGTRLFMISQTESSAGNTTDIMDRAIPPIFTINFLITMGFFFYRWRFQAASSGIKYQEFLILGLFAAYLFLYLGSFWAPRLKPALLSCGLSHLAIISIFSLLEIVLPAIPRLIPSAIINRNPSLVSGIGPKPAEMVEYLEDSPWVKFKADTRIRSQGSRGSDFVYEWNTDKLGYKNVPPVVDSRRVTALALGDSFVEAMGVAPEQTWPSLLTSMGYPTYNLGVQGYSPTQILGSLKRFGPLFQTDYVIVGYTPGFEERELQYVNSDRFKKEKVFTGAINDVSRYMKEVRNPYNHFRITNATIDLVKAALSSGAEHFRVNYRCAQDPVLGAARLELLNSGKVLFDADSLHYRMTQNALLDMKRTTTQMRAKLVVVIFTQRSLAYHEKLLGRHAPADHYELQLRKSLSRFLLENGIAQIDMLPVLSDYMRTWDAKNDSDGSKLPYFLIDGHMNGVGQRLVAEEVGGYLRRQTGRGRRDAILGKMNHAH